MQTWLIILLGGLAAYELFEHLILPLVWAIRSSRRKSEFGPSGMIGKQCVVKQWDGKYGKVRFGGELWNAGSDADLAPGDVVVVREINGLTLLVRPFHRPAGPPTRIRSGRSARRIR